MAFELLRKFFQVEAAPDPTLDWPELHPATPGINLATRQVGPVAFGDSLANARCFGRPDSWRFLKDDYLELVYTRAGFQLDFEKARLAYAAFFVAPDEFDPSAKELVHCAVREESGIRLSATTTQADLAAWLGAPDSVDAIDANDVIVTYLRHGLELEFELNRAKRLKRWNLFPRHSSPS